MNRLLSVSIVILLLAADSWARCTTCADSAQALSPEAKWALFRSVLLLLTPAVLGLAALLYLSRRWKPASEAERTPLPFVTPSSRNL